MKEYPECNSIVHNIEYKVLQMLRKSEIPIKIVNKLAVLDIVGNIGSDLIGVSDSRFAREYARGIKQVTKNEEHMLVLLKNQTSVIESHQNIL